MNNKKNNKNNILIFKKQSYKFVVFLITASFFLSILNVGEVYAYFNDSVIVNGTNFSTGTLNISLDNTNDYSSDWMYLNDSTTTNISLSNIGSLNSQYIASTTVVGADTEACDYITMTATTSFSSYTGYIKDFISSATTTVNTTWNFSFTISPNIPHSMWGKTCSFKWIYTAWQENFSSPSGGFFVKKEKNGFIKIGKHIVLNEILPNPEGSDTQSGLQGEWVELYNNSNTSIDVSGWKIKDTAGHTKIISTANTFNGRTTVGSKGTSLEWIVVFMNDDIMNNDSKETISLYDSSDNLIDQYSYNESKNDSDSDSNSTGGGSNNTPSGTETSGNEGKSFARIPDGVGEWIDPVPTPGRENKLENFVSQNNVNNQNENLIYSTNESLPPDLPDTEVNNLTSIQENKNEYPEDSVSQDKKEDSVNLSEPNKEQIIIEEPVMTESVPTIKDITSEQSI